MTDNKNKQIISGKSPISLIDTTLLNEYLVSRPKQKGAAGYDFVDWANDAASAIWRGAQESDMKADQDEMLEAQQAIRLAKDALSSEEDFQLDIALDNLKKIGVWKEDKNPTKEDLQKIIDEQTDRYSEREQSYLYNLEEYKNSVKNYDISQYYTRRSNSDAGGWSKWLYTLPATMGTSFSAMDYQATSMAAAWAGAKTGGAAGAAVGTAISPGAGTFLGGVVGAIGGIAGAQYGGGIQARKQESHMEAFMAYSEQVKDKASKSGIDVSNILTNVRQQLVDKGIDPTYMTDDMVMDQLLVDPELSSGSSEFDKIRQDSYAATRRVYDRNNALGMGEIISDLSYILPLRRWTGSLFGKIISPVTKPLGKAISKTIPNTLKDALNFRFKTGLSVAAAGVAARNRNLAKNVSDFLKDSAFRGIIEGTEEGAQRIISDRYKQGMYDDEYAHGDYSSRSFFDLSTYGGYVDPFEEQTYSDVASTVHQRVESLGAWMGLNDEYKDDDQMVEEMWSGYLISLLNPLGLVSLPKTISKVNTLASLPKIASYLERSLTKQDAINGRYEYLKTVREGLPSGRRWEEALDLLGEELKNVKADGRTRTYDLDALSLTDGKNPASNEDVDKFIEDQKTTGVELNNFRNSLLRKLKKNNISIPDDDTDLYVAIASTVMDDAVAAEKLVSESKQGLNKFLNDDKTIKTLNDVLSDEEQIDQVTKDEILRLHVLGGLLYHLSELSEKDKIRSTVIEKLRKHGILRKINAIDEASVQLLKDKYIGDIVKQYDKFNDKLSDKIGEDRLIKILDSLQDDDNIYTQTLDIVKSIASSELYQKAIRDKYAQYIERPTKERVEDSVRKYLDLTKRQSKLADNANAAARQGVDPEQSKQTSNVIDTTVEKLNEITESNNAVIVESLTAIDNIVSSVTEDGPVKDFINAVMKRADAFSDNPVGKARYLSKLMKRLKHQYTNSEAAEKFSKEDKDTIDKLLNLADQLENSADELIKINAEQKAKSTRHNAKLKSNLTNQIIWTDESGQGYVVDYEGIEYSENEGAILTLNKVDNSIDESSKKLDELNTQIEELEKKIQAYGTASTKAKQRDESRLEVLKNTKKMLEDSINNPQNDKLVVNANEKSEWLKSLKHSDRKGTTITFEKKLNDINKTVNKAIEANKKKRNERANTAVFTGDVFDFLENDNTKHAEEGKTKPKYKLNAINFSRGEIKTIKSYPLFDDSRTASAILNPHHISKFWNGHFIMPYHDPEMIMKKFKSHTFERDGVEYDRVKAAKTYNYIGKAIADAKERKEYKADEVYSALEALYNGSEEETIAGKKITQEEYYNMVIATPFQLKLYSPRTGGAAYTMLVTDYGAYKRLTEYSEEERQARAEFVHTMLNHFKKNDKKNKTTQDQAAESYTDINFDEGQSEPDYISRFYFGEDLVKVYPGDFNYNVISVRDEKTFIFKNEDGSLMSNSEIQSVYDSVVPDATTQALPHIDKIISVLKSLGFSSVTEELLNKKDESGKSAFYKVVEAVLKYGDGVLSATSLHEALRDSIGLLEKRSNVKQDATTERARDLFYAFADIIPTHFKSFNDSANLADFPVDKAVEISVNRGFFKNKLGIKIFDAVSGDQINIIDKHNIEETKNLFKFILDALNSSDTFTEFYNLITSQYRFKQSESSIIAENTLRNYFNAVKFNRYANNGNIVQVFGVGSSSPTGEEVNYAAFNRREKHQQKPISELKSLGIQKDENGKYHFSTKEWVEKHVNNKEEQSSSPGVKNEVDVAREQSTSSLRSLLSKINELNAKTNDDVTLTFDALLSVLTAFQVIAPSYFEHLDVNETGYVLKQNKTLKQTIRDIKSNIEEDIAKIENNFEETYIKQQEEALKADDSFEGKEHSFVHFAVGSFKTKDGVSVIYKDNQGNRHTVDDVDGTPGAIYMILPGFFSAARERQLAKLNPVKLNNHFARCIAGLLDRVREGDLQMDQVPDGSVWGGHVQVQSNGTIRQIIDALVYNGTEALANNPGAQHNEELLLYVDSNNQVHFGDNILNDDNLDDLISFLEKKPMRIDMDKITDINAVFGIDLKMSFIRGTFEEVVLMDVKALDNYVATVIENKLLLSDLAANKNDKLYAKPYVYTKFSAKNKLSKPVANDRNSKGSAADAKNTLTDDDFVPMDDVRETINELTTPGSITIQLAVKKFQQGFSKILDKAAERGEIDTIDYSVEVYNENTNKSVTSPFVKIRYEQPSNDSDGGFVTVIDNSPEFMAFLIEAHNNNMSRLLFRIVDEKGKQITVNKKSVGKWLSLDEIKYEQQLKQNQQQSKTVLNNNPVDLQEIINAATKAATEAAVQALLQNGVQPASAPIQPSSQQKVAIPDEAPGTQLLASMISFGLPDGSDVTLPSNLTLELFEEKMTEEFGEPLSELYQQYQFVASNSKMVPLQKQQDVQDDVEDPSADAIPVNVSGNPSSPIGVVLAAASKPAAPANEQLNKLKNLPTFAQLLDWQKAKDSVLYNKLINSLSIDKHDIFASGRFATFLAELGLFKSLDDAIKFVNTPEGKKYVSNAKSVYKRSIKANLASVFNFENEHVEKENYDEAVSTVKEIIGNVHIEELDVVSEEYDDARGANMFVYGACGESAIWIYKQLVDGENKIVKGSLYHEAFHKISLFILSEKDRIKMYEQARKEHPELAFASDKAVEEYLANEFAARVSIWKNKGKNAVYSDNFLIRMFQKMNNLINKIVEVFKTNHITDEHVDMNKLFRDMYKGRYKYAKATRKNKELFNKIYSPRVAFTGMLVNGTIIAEDARQYAQIKRDLIDRAVTTSSIMLFANGNVTVKLSEIKKSIQIDIAKSSAEAKQLNAYIDNPDLLNGTGVTIDSIVDAYIANLRRIEVLNNIIRDEQWSEWSNIISSFVSRTFGMEKVDANEQLESTDQDGDSKPVIDNSAQRDSVSRNMYKELDVNMKALLWTIVDGDVNNPSALKYTPDGLWIYAKIDQLYNNIIRAVNNASSVEDMMKKLAEAAKQEINVNQDYTLQQFYARLNPEKVNSNINAIRNSVYTAFVRHIHKFQNYVYESTEHKYTAPNGKEYVTVSYEGSVRSGNLDAVSQNIKNVWRRNLVLGFTNIASKLSKGESYSNIVKPLKDASSKLKLVKHKEKESIAATISVLRQLGEIFAMEFKNNDLEKAAKQIIDAKQIDTLLSFTKDLYGLVQKDINSIKAINGDKKTRKTFDLFFENVTGMKSSFFMLTERLASHQKPDAKSNSQRGPGNTKIYSIGAYNFITRLFTTRMILKDWITKLSTSIYTASSEWLRQLKAGIKPQIHTKLQTQVDGSFTDSVADINTAPHEDMLNRLLTILAKQFNSPSLANKRFAAAFEGFLFPETVDMVITKEGSITDQYVTRFTKYFADEILAIADAMKTRQEFIDKLNEVIGAKVPYTIQSFSKLTSEQQEEIFRNESAAALLSMLVNQYHYEAGKKSLNNVNGRYVYRAFHIDLTKGTGYKFRHFSNIGKRIKFDEQLVNSLSENKGMDHDIRQPQILMAYELAEQYKNEIHTHLQKNVIATLAKFALLGLIHENPSISPLGVKVNINSLDNRMIPHGAFSNFEKNTEKSDYSPSGMAIYRLAAYFTIMDSIGLLEFEKLVTGDTAYLKNITAVNKRYSGPCSTIDVTSESGFIHNAFGEDRLMNSKTYNSLTLNTTIVVNTDKFEADIKNAVGENIIKTYDISKGSVKPVYDYNDLLDEKGEFKNPNAPLVKLYITSSKNGLRKGVNSSGNPLSNKLLAEKIMKDAINRFSNYLHIDPTDAQAFASAEMYRQLMQRNGRWDEYKEACYNLLENYDRIFTLFQTHSTQLMQMCNILGIKDVNELKEKAQQFTLNPAKYAESYKGWIISKTSKLDCTSLKYVYFGEGLHSYNGLHTPIYDKMSIKPIFKIFADGHQMKELYDLMKSRQIDFVKMETATKVGGIPSFELYDENGSINKKSLKVAPIQKQLFELLGKQLNTDPHDAGQTSLLTQFMKVANMNIQEEATYNVGKEKIKGNVLRQLYNDIIDNLTSMGQSEFLQGFGITKENGKYSLDKAKFMSKLKQMGATLDLPADTLNSFEVDPITGDFKIHPSAMPNLRWIQSRLISEMGKKVIDTATPGMPLYQVASAGFDNIFNIKNVSDRHLNMPGENGSKHMEVRLSIKFFEDILKLARKDETVREKYKGLNTFDQQRRFILENQELFSLSYRVPTQGLNSTIPIKIVDVLAPQEGGIIMFPSGITAQTGSDFDIDKMFLARYNYTVENGKLTKVKYSVQDYLNDVQQNKEQLQNMLIDIYIGVLTNEEHYLAANTPLDVCTAPLSNFARSVSNIGKMVNELPAIPEEDEKDVIHNIVDKNRSVYKSYIWNNQANQFEYLGTFDATQALYEEQIDLYHTNPSFQTAQKLKNAGSDAGIGPMALNSVFGYFTQVAKLKMYAGEYLRKLGIANVDQILDRNGDDILDVTSALINAHVDAVKDNYIGAVNVNQFTFSMTAFLTRSGFGNDTFAFLVQPILKDLATEYSIAKNGTLNISPDYSKGNKYFELVKERWTTKLNELSTTDNIFNANPYGLPSEDEMKTENLTKAMLDTNTAQGVARQLRYLNLFVMLQEYASAYSDMINTSQVDTKKFGKSVDEIISFKQRVEQAHSSYNTVFENPSDVFDKTFLGTKWNKGVLMLLDAFNSTIFEFGQVYLDAAETLSRQWGRYGRYSAEFMRRVGPRLKSVFHVPFFNQYLIERFPNNTAPLRKLFVGSESVAARYDDIYDICLENGIATDFFELVTYTPVASDSVPQFFKISDDVKNDQNIANVLLASISEMFESKIPRDKTTRNKVTEWITDFAVMMFYLTGGTDTNAGGMIRTTVYDLIPPQHLANISTKKYGSYNKYVENVVNNSKTFNQTQLDQAMMLTALTDDKIVPTLKLSEVKPLINRGSVAEVIYVGYNSNKVAQVTQGTFNRFIKVKDANGQIIVYKLGNIVVTGKDENKSYKNPLYFRIGNLGYRNSAFAAYSIRTDGMIDSNGNIKSLLGNAPGFEAQKFDQLDSSKKALIEKHKVFDKYHIREIIDADTYSPYPGIDNSTIVFQLRDVQSGITKQYAEIKNKPFVAISSNDLSVLNNVPTNSVITILGLESMPEGFVSEIFDELPPSVTLVTEYGYPVQKPGVVGTVEKILYDESYNRERAKRSPRTLYIFTDNTDRTSYADAAIGKKSSETRGWYYQKYGRDEHGSDKNETTAVLRGLNNAAPISTMKWFYKAHPGATIEQSRWTDADIEQFKEVIDDEINQIKNLWSSGNFDKVVFPGKKDGFIAGGISNINPKSEIGLYLQSKVDELKLFINDYKETPELMSKEGEQRKKDCL